MSMISQSGVNAAMAAANEAAGNYCGTISSETANFCNSVGQIWACAYATEFAQSLKEGMDSIISTFSTNMNTFKRLLDTSAANYQKANHGDPVIVPEVEFTKTEVDVSGIKEYLPENVTEAPDGQGMAEGHSTSEVKEELGNLIEKITTATSDAVDVIKNSAAFDSEETAAISNTFSSIGTILENDIDTLKKEVDEFFGEVDDQYANTKNANIENAQSTSAG